MQLKQLELDAGNSVKCNSRWPLDRLHYVFVFHDPVTLTFDILT